jgi:hypothetical protein
VALFPARKQPKQMNVNVMETVEYATMNAFALRKKYTIINTLH